MHDGTNAPFINLFSYVATVAHFSDDTHSYGTTEAASTWIVVSIFVATARKIGAAAAIIMPAPANQNLDQYKIPTLLD